METEGDWYENEVTVKSEIIDEHYVNEVLNICYSYFLQMIM